MNCYLTPPASDDDYELHVERTVRVDDQVENVLREHFIDQALLEELA